MCQPQIVIDLWAEKQAWIGHAFAAEVKKMIEELESSGHGFSAIIICPFFDEIS